MPRCVINGDLFSKVTMPAMVHRRVRAARDLVSALEHGDGVPCMAEIPECAQRVLFF